MSLLRKVFVVVAGLVCVFSVAVADGPNLGKNLTLTEIKALDIDIGLDGEGLPKGEGAVSLGKDLYEMQCQACHGANGVGGHGLADRLVGGGGSLKGSSPVKTIGSFWPYAPTLFDYIRRAMPYYAPLSLSDEEAYAVTAYLLWLNGVIDETEVMNAETLPRVVMPNREGFVQEAEF